MNDEINAKLEKLEKQIAAYDVNTVVTGDQYEQERRVSTHGDAILTLKDTKSFLRMGREIKGRLLRDLDAAIENTK